MHQFKSEVHIIAKVVNLSKKQGIFEKNFHKTQKRSQIPWRFKKISIPLHRF